MDIYNHSLTPFVWKLLQYLQFSGFCSIVSEVSILLEYDSVSVDNSFQTFWDNDGLKMSGMYYPVMWDHIPGEWKHVITTLFFASLHFK